MSYYALDELREAMEGAFKLGGSTAAFALVWAHVERFKPMFGYYAYQEAYKVFQEVSISNGDLGRLQIKVVT